MQGNTARRASIILGVFMAVVLIAGAILPLLRDATASTPQTIDPTEAPVPTFPPPPTDFSAIAFDQYYLHPTGLYIIAQPTGFTQVSPSSQATIAQVNMVNQEIFSVIDAYVEDPLMPVTSADLDARFNQATLASTWTRFSNYEELSRRMDGEALLIDFEVEFQRQTYVARQRVWTDGDWIYVVRVLAPENAVDYLVHLLNNLSSSLQPFKFFLGTPFNWQAYYDHLLSHIIRYPSGWTVADSAPGRPASITGTNGEALRVEALPGTSVEDEEAARAWVQSQRSGTTVMSVVPIVRDETSGFSVAYNFTTADGAPQSGLAVLLNGEDGTLHAANLRFPAEAIDLHTLDFILISDDQELPEITPEPEVTEEATPDPEATAEATPEATPDPMLAYTDLALVMSTFRLMPPLTLSPESLPELTPTPLPTAVPLEQTAEATPEATDEPEATEAAATEEATIEAGETEEAAEPTPTEEAEEPTEAPTEEPTANNLERFAATATALAESRRTPTATP